MSKRLKCDGQTNTQDGQLYKLDIEAFTEKTSGDQYWSKVCGMALKFLTLMFLFFFFNITPLFAMGYISEGERSKVKQQ